jgi:hypothetical protein
MALAVSRESKQLMIAAPVPGYAARMTQSTPGDRQSDPVDPDGDPAMKQSASQPDQAEGSDDDSETGAD